MTLKTLESAGRDALTQMTPAGTIGELLSTEQTDNIATLRYSSHMPGYAGWDWVVSLTVEGDDTTILETELVAGDEAVVAPDWVPWADRLREYEESLAAGIEEEEVIIVDEDDLDDEDDDEDDESDDDDFDALDGVEEAGSVDDGDDEYVVVDDED